MLNVDRIACGYNNQTFVCSARDHCVDRKRHDIEVDTGRTDNGDLMIGDGRLCDAGHSILHVLPWHRWGNRPHVTGIDQSWLGHQPRPQRALLRQQIEGVAVGTRSTVLANVAHNIGERLVCRTVAVQQLKCLAIMRSDADF